MSSNDNKTGNGENYYNKLIDSAQQKIDGLQAQIEKWEQEQQRLNADLKEYNTLLDAAKKIQAGENITKGYEKATKEAKKTEEKTKDIGKSADDAGIKHLFFYFAEDSKKAIPYFMLDSEVWGKNQPISSMKPINQLYRQSFTMIPAHLIV